MLVFVCVCVCVVEFALIKCFSFSFSLVLSFCRMCKNGGDETVLGLSRNFASFFPLFSQIILSEIISCRCTEARKKKNTKRDEKQVKNIKQSSKQCGEWCIFTRMLFLSFACFISFSLEPATHRLRMQRLSRLLAIDVTLCRICNKKIITKSF